MDRVHHLGEDVAIDRGAMEAEAGSCLFMFLLHSGNRERHACLVSSYLSARLYDPQISEWCPPLSGWVFLHQ